MQAQGGLNHPLLLDSDTQFSCSLSHSKSGRRLTMNTSATSVVAYTGNHFDGSLAMENGHKIQQYGGIALEAQQLPDAISHPGFGSIILHPNKTFHGETLYHFDVCKE